MWKDAGSVVSSVSAVSFGDDVSIARSYTLVHWGTLDADALREQFGVGLPHVSATTLAGSSDA